jgi:membrane-bound serine protease (ClpP class)
MELVVILLVAGVVLLLLETVLPGLIAGIVGFGCLMAGVVLGYVEFGVYTGNIILVAVLAGLIIGFACWVKFFPDSRMARVLVSKGTSGDIKTEQPQLLNQIGVAYTQLRPSGTALINGKRVDVVTEGALIPRGTPIKVLAIEGMRVVVRALEEDQQMTAQELKQTNT